MSDLKNAAKLALETATRITPRVQTILEQWQERNKPVGFELRLFKSAQEPWYDGGFIDSVTSTLALIEENDADVTRFENESYGWHLRQATDRFKVFADESPSRVSEIESHLNNPQDAARFDDINYLDLRLGFDVPTKRSVNYALVRARDEYRVVSRSPEQVLRDMMHHYPFAWPDDTTLFRQLFDFETRFGDTDIYDVVPGRDANTAPQYIGGDLTLDDYNSNKRPNNFVWVAIDKLVALNEIYNEAKSSGYFLSFDDYGLTDAVRGLVDEGMQLEEAVKQIARPIMQQVVDAAYEKYGAYRDEIIAGVENKQSKYELSDDIVNEFTGFVKKAIGAFIEDVEDAFSEEAQFNSGGDWGVFASR